MTYVIRFWATLIGLGFALAATVISASLGLACSVILLACALACTLIFYFFPNASDIIEQATQIVISPLRFTGQIISAVWQQLSDIVTGRARSSSGSGSARNTAAITILLTLSAGCFVAVAVAPISSYLTVLGYIAASLIAVIVVAVVSIRLSDGSNDVIRVSTVAIVVAVFAATVAGIAISSFELKTLALTLSIVVLLLFSVMALVVVWDETT